MRRVSVCGLLAILCAPVVAGAQEPAAESGGVHVVRRGDTLWDLAGRYLRDPFLWPAIFSANRGTVSDPHWIFPDERLRIPGLAAAAAGVGSDGAAAPAGRTVFYTPAAAAGRTATSTVVPVAATEVPAVPAGSYYAAGVLLPDSALAPVGELLSVVSPTVVQRRSEPQIQPYDRVTLRVLGEVGPGDRLHLLRPEQRVEPYGRVFQPTGTARVLEVAGDLATVEVDHFYDAVRPGDLALPLPAYTPRPGGGTAAGGALEGALLTLRGGAVAGTEDVGFVDLGAASGVVEGDELVAYIPAAAAATASDLEVARLQVVRTGRLTSAVRVVTLEHPALEPGMRVRRR